MVEAEKRVQASYPIAGTTAEESLVTAGPLPAWALRLHQSHRLSSTGCAVWCETCSSVLAAHRVGPLTKPCTGPGRKGSQGKVVRLMRGSCKHCGRQSWPTRI